VLQTASKVLAAKALSTERRSEFVVASCNGVG
jgi:hypothetical protein